ncbi:hypothetical protein TNCT_176321 [Trichonephila clavata]|uniref:Uncharacterized protein n=1 Tax=Trichonephila clavata TaxID=2740835 RepID=A0A8X6LC27_TRICU|nr:hypothetical protein TNCT_176321 [Trichonephila clavata]
MYGLCYLLSKRGYSPAHCPGPPRIRSIDLTSADSSIKFTALWQLESLFDQPPDLGRKSLEKLLGALKEKWLLRLHSCLSE